MEYVDMAKKLTDDEFVIRAKKVHGEKYDYLLTKYCGWYGVVKIICPVHGEFEQKGGDHLEGCGCAKCGGAIKKTNDEFVVDAKKIHGELYDYSLVEYNGNKNPVAIICKIHGKFSQTPNSHSRGAGCPLCGDAKTLAGVSSSTSKFIADAKSIHGEKFDYSAVKYVGNKQKVAIICPTHGKFLQRPNEHLSGYGCAQCAGSVKKTTAEFVAQAVKIYGDLYDYSLVNYISNKTPVTIICKKHGPFKKYPTAHIYKHEGCSKCIPNSVSKPEVEFMKHIGISENTRQHPICPGCVVDGYDPPTNTVYEFLGDYWHGNPKIYPSEKLNKNTNSTFGKLYEKTFSRFNDISKLGCTIKYIWESDWKTWKKAKIGTVPLETYVPQISPDVYIQRDFI